MYGGLFGDLPAAKGEKNSTDDAAEKKDVREEEAVSKATQNKSTRKDENAVASFIPPAATKNKKPGLTQSLGAAGTSMAFIPTAIKKRKKPNRFAAVAAAPKIPPSSATSAPERTTTNPFAATTTIFERAQPQGAPVDIHAPHNPLPQSQQPHGALEFKSTEENSSTLPSHEISNQLLRTSVLERVNLLDDNMRDSDGDRDEEEPITDPYDPYVPNDLLQYWDQQAREKEQRQLERETQLALENQKLLRMQLEHERQALIQGSNLERLDSRGRGRGMSNLPAWLVAKQAQEKQDKLGSNPGA